MILGYHRLLEVQATHEIIRPFDEALVQPASIDMRLDSDLLYDAHPADVLLDPFEQQYMSRDAVRYRPLQPLRHALACTVEDVKMPLHLAGRVEGKSSLARLGLMVHTTAGWIDPGFGGPITLELFNCSHRPFLLTPRMTICQLSLYEVDGARAYEGKYGLTAEGGPQPSRYHLNARP